MEQRSPEWFAARLGKATASSFFKIMSKTPAPRRNYLIDLVQERLSGQPTESYTNAAMQWGIDHEDEAADAYYIETGNEVKKAPFVDHKFLLAGCSPDRYVGKDGLVEIKCPNPATHIGTLHAKHLPPQYKAQVQGQMWITGRKWCDFVSYDPRLVDENGETLPAAIVIIRVERDEEYIAKLEQEVEAFLDEVEKEYQYIKEWRQLNGKINK